MKEKFNYLQNEEAVGEILKHKWIESQKAGREIGFVTAAVDWIKKYGEEWKKARGIDNGSSYQQLPELAERRQYRRIKIDLPIKIRMGDWELKTRIKEFNHIGAEFFSDTPLPAESPVEITVSSESNPKNKLLNFHLKAKVIKSTPFENLGSQDRGYLIFTRFDRNTRQKIIDNKGEIFN